LEHLEFTSFNRVTGYSSLLSASDTAYAVTALLEYDISEMSMESKENKGSTSGVSVEAFNNAYDALGTHSEPMRGFVNRMGVEGYDASNLVNGGNLSSNVGLGAGLRYAMALQKSIIQTAVGLMERGSIALLRHFRYAHVTSSTVGESHRAELLESSRNNIGNEKRDHIFSKPLALTRLAHFLMDLNRESGKWTGAKARPLVLVAEKPQSNTCLIVGYEYPDRAGDFVKNEFGKHFQMTTGSMSGSFKYDSFDSNVVEVNSGDVQRFLEQLHYMMDNA
jgi:cell division control protein 45